MSAKMRRIFDQHFSHQILSCCVVHACHRSTHFPNMWKFHRDNLHTRCCNATRKKRQHDKVAHKNQNDGGDSFCLRLHVCRGSQWEMIRYKMVTCIVGVCIQKHTRGGPVWCNFQKQNSPRLRKPMRVICTPRERAKHTTHSPKTNNLCVYMWSRRVDSWPCVSRERSSRSAGAMRFQDIVENHAYANCVHKPNLHKNDDGDSFFLRLHV